MMLIDEFMNYYKSVYPDLRKVEETALELLKNKLHDTGTKAIVTSRVKDVISLREKIIKRDKDEHYSTIEQIKNDIVDLVGLRVALYFPSDANRVETTIKELFKIVKVKTFPIEQRKTDDYKRRFVGYCANHYRVYLRGKRDVFAESQIIEIQVASLLMHAWSEVEHDLVYKTTTGTISFDEHETLDEINGLMIVGELSLQRLQRISNQRIMLESKIIETHFQLADIIYEYCENKTSKFVNIGDVDTLFHLLEKKDRLTVQKVKNDLDKIDLSSSISISQQLLDFYADTLPDNLLVYNSIRNKAYPWNPNENSVMLVGVYLQHWIKLEKCLIKFSERDLNRGDKWSNIIHERDIRNNSDIPSNIRQRYSELRKVRNGIVHGNIYYNDDDLTKYISEVKLLQTEIDKKLYL